MKRISSSRQAGSMRIEINILIAIIGLGLAIGLPRYAKHGVWGVVLGFLMAVGIIVGGIILIALIFEGIGWIQERLEKFTLYNLLVALFAHLFRLCLFMGFSAFVWMLVAFRCGWEGLWNDHFIAIMSVPTGIILFLAHLYSRQKVWNGLLRFCGGILMGLFGAIMGLFVQDMPFHVGPLKGIDLGAVVFVIIYIVACVISSRKKEDSNPTVRF